MEILLLAALVFVLSIPVFYVYGIISFVLMLTRRFKESSSTPHQPTQTYAPVEQQKAEHSHNTTTPNVRTAEISSTQIKKVNPSLSNWYSEHAINLILYLGAFLIVAAVSIYIGFQWGTLSGIAKASSLTVVAVLFGLSGIITYNMKKLRSAGSVFIGIAALLIPMVFIGWHNFVLADRGVDSAAVWLAASLTSLAVYAALAWWMNSRFYSYVASVGMLSTTLSLVDVFNGSDSTFVIAGLACAIVLFGIKLLVKNRAYAAWPTEISAHVIAPLFIFLGIIDIFVNTSFNTLYSTSVFLMATLFYVLAYIEKQQHYYLAMILLLYPVGVATAVQTSNINDFAYIYALVACAAFNIVILSWLRSKHHNVQQYIALVASILLASIAFVLSWLLGDREQVIVLLLIALTFVGLAAITQYAYIYIASALVTLFTVYTVCVNILNWSVEQTSLIYGGIGLTLFGAALFVKLLQPKAYHVALATALIYLFTGQGFSIDSEAYIVGHAVLFAILMYTYVVIKREWPIAYVGNFYIAIATGVFLIEILQIDSQYAPLMIAGLMFVYLLLYILLHNPLSNISLHTLYALTAVGVISGSEVLGTQSLEEGLLLVITGVLLASFIASWMKEQNVGYIYLVIGTLVVAYMQTILLVDVSETLAYTIPAGMYVIGIGIDRTIRFSDFIGVEHVGLLILMAPVATYGFSESEAVYTIIFLLLSLVLLIGGISAKRSLYTYSGAAALALWVISRTYEYVLDLPKWVLVGSLGLLFLIAAVYLLYTRKED